MSAMCPSCYAPQDEGLLCVTCTQRLDYALSDVPAVVTELDVTLSKQARMENASKGGLARERNAYHGDASIAAGVLENTLITWARDVSNESWQPEGGELIVARAKTSPYIGPFHDQCRHRSCERMRVCWVEPAPVAVLQAAHLLRSEMPAIRKHPAVDEMLDQIESAIQQAWSTVDRAANRTRFPVGPCPEADEDGVHCIGHIFAFIPTEDERPPRMECRANPEHRWTSIQWLKTGKRILDRAAQIRRQARGAA